MKFEADTNKMVNMPGPPSSSLSSPSLWSDLRGYFTNRVFLILFFIYLSTYFEWGGFKTIFTFETMKTGGLSKMWEGGSLALTSVTYIFGPVLAARWIHQGRLTLIFISGAGAYMAGAFWGMIFSHVHWVILAPLFIGFGQNLLGAFLTNGLSVSLGGKNSLVSWTIVRSCGIYSETLGAVVAGLISFTPFMMSLGALSIGNGGILEWARRSYAVEAFKSPKNISSQKDIPKGSLKDLWQSTKRVIAFAPLSIWASILTALPERSAFYSEYCAQLGVKKSSFAGGDALSYVAVALLSIFLAFKIKDISYEKALGVLAFSLGIGSLLMFCSQDLSLIYAGNILIQVGEGGLWTYAIFLLTICAQDKDGPSFAAGYAFLSSVKGIVGVLMAFGDQWIFDHGSPQGLALFWVSLVGTFLLQTLLSPKIR